MLAVRSLPSKRYIGFNHTLLKHRTRQFHNDAFTALTINQPKTFLRDPNITAKICALRSQSPIHAAEFLNHYAMTAHNNLELLIDGEKAYASLQNALEDATDSIHLSYFQFLNDSTGNQLADILIKKAKEGVKIRIITDSIGSQLYTSFSSHDIFERLRAHNIEVIQIATFSPTTADNTYLEPPDHRKIVVIDGQTAFTGGMNIGDHYRFDWHDLMIKVAGPAVHQMQLEWMQSWMQHKGTLDSNVSHEDFLTRYFPLSLSTGSMHAKICQGIPSLHSEIRSTAFSLINQAKKSLSISSPYISDPAIFNALIQAAHRGVAVTLFTPAHNNSITNAIMVRSWYANLLNAGVHVYEYPGMSHLKCLLSDDEFVSIGSANFDGLSLYHIKEMNLYVENTTFAQHLKNSLFQKDIDSCKKVTMHDLSYLYWIAGCVLSPVAYLL